MNAQQLTITEALQEIKTINKRLERKRQSVLQYIARDSRIRDPLEKDGGSEKFVSQERQALNDLESRIVAIRTAIQKSNLESFLSIGGQTKTVAEWLTWRREVSAQSTTFMRTITSALANIRTQLQTKGGGRVLAAAVAVNEAGGPNDPPQIAVNLDEKKLLEEQENAEQVLGDLDGKLSLFNATSVIKF